MKVSWVIIFTMLILGHILDVAYASTMCMEFHQFDKSTMIRKKMSDAENQITKGDYYTAQKSLNSLLRLDPNNSRANQLLKECKKGILEQKEMGNKVYSDSYNQSRVSHVEELLNKPAQVENQQDDFVDDNVVYTKVNIMPGFPGGLNAMLQFVAKNVRYPIIAQENGIQGTVECSFIVNRDGSICDAKVEKQIDPSLDAEALRVIRSMPRWYPGKINGKPVRVLCHAPITFRLQ